MQSLFSDAGLQLIFPEDIGLSLEVEESGDAYHTASGLPALADDSGLEVKALNDAPGLHSARFLRVPNATDGDRRNVLIQKLSTHPHPWAARFISVMALALPDGKFLYSKGICNGEIIRTERGDNGFGYDPIFLCEGMEKTMAELALNEKNRISHRARAAVEMRTKLLPYIGSD